MSRRSLSWPVPFFRSLDGEYQPGQTVFIKGFMIGDQFVVNLATGSNAGGDNSDPIGLHLNPRVREKVFVLNTFKRDDGWGKEERHKLTLKPDEEFDMRIRAHEEHFEIFVNGKSLFNYKYRLPLTEISHLYIDGGVELYHVSWEGRYYPIPYFFKLDGMMTGQSVYVSGLVDGKAKQFVINLKCDDNIALHFNPRLFEKTVVRNSFIDGEWGPEEREGEFTFKKNRTFDVIIGCTDVGFDMFIDGVPFSSFTHRIPPGNITALVVDGDLKIQGIHW